MIGLEMHFIRSHNLKIKTLGALFDAFVLLPYQWALFAAVRASLPAHDRVRITGKTVSMSALSPHRCYRFLAATAATK